MQVSPSSTPSLSLLEGLRNLRWPQWLLVGLLLAASSYLRLHGLRDNGIIGSDTFQYWDIALQWSQGEFVLNNNLEDPKQYFRPIFYGLNALSLKLFGLHDYSLRAMIGIFETLNVFLVFLIGSVLSRSRFLFGFLLAATYALIPSTIFLSQIELPHSYSVTFTLLSYLSYLSVLGQARDAKSSPRKLGFVLTGLLAGCAATTHGSTTFLGPIFVLLFGAEILRRKEIPRRERWKEAWKRAGLFTAGFAVPYILGGAIVGYPEMVRAIISERGIRAHTGHHHLSLFWAYLSDGPRESISPLVMGLFWGALLYWAYGLWRKRFDLWEYSPLLLVVGFSLIFSLTFRNVFYPRLFLPFNLFVLLPIFLAAQEIFQRLRPSLAPALMIAFVVPLAWFTFSPGADTVMRHFRGEAKGGPREVFDAIGAEVGNDAKLLVGPYLQYYMQKQFHAAAYFGKNAVYLMECGEGKNLDSFIAGNRILFVLLSKDVDPRLLEKFAEPHKNIGLCTGMDFPSYDLEKDLEALRRFLLSRGAQSIAIDPEIGELYRLAR